MASIEQSEIQQKIIEQEAELRDVPHESARREIRQRIFKLQEQFDRHMGIYGSIECECRISPLGGGCRLQV